MTYDPDRVVCCDHCAKALYRVHGDRIRGISAEDAETQPPVTLTIRSQLIVCFCSKACAARWLLQQPDSDLRGGYPLRW